MKKSFIDRIQSETIKPKDRLLFSGLCLLLTPLLVVLTAGMMLGMSGWLLYLAVRQIITKEEL